MEPVIDWDESVYFTVSRDILTGGIPYKTSWDHKGPLLYFMFIPAIKIFGINILALRIFTTVCLWISMLFLYLASGKILNDKERLIPPLIYGLFFSHPFFGGLASNSELFMMMFLVIATYFFFKYIQNARPAYLSIFYCGIFCALAVFIKTTAFFTAMSFPVYLFFRRNWLGGYEPGRLLREIKYYLFGTVIVILPIIGYFLLHNAVTDFFYAFFYFNFQYVRTTSLFDSITNFLDFLKLATILRPELITLVSFISIAYLLLKRDMSREEKHFFILVILLTFFSFMGVLAGRHMFNHYFLQMGLPFSILIAFAVSQIKINRADLNKICICIVLALLFMSSIRPSGKLIDRKSEKKVISSVSDYISRNSSANDTIFVNGGQPVIYFLSNRSAPTKYFFWLYHCSPWEDILHLEKETVTAFSNNAPRYFVYTKDFLGRKAEYLDKFMLDNYHVVNKVGSYIIYEKNKI